ncbi:MAG: selenocysteine-specific translation elongation factor [Burkholderiaceae bacterium]
MIVGTAGHIDHGKTTLVRALTGIDADRLPEEKRRGITIELGYAALQAPAGEVSFIDVPGHEKLVHTMLAGASGIDFALLLAAADDGVMPQTMEHLTILSLLEISRGAGVVTKADRVDEATLHRRKEELRALLEGAGLGQWPVLGVSAQSGEGVEALRALLASEAARPARDAGTHEGFRMGLDRVFSLGGVGTVVAGTIAAGSVRIGDSLCLAHAPGRALRVRSLQAHGRAVEEAIAGQRCAIGLAGLERSEVERGQVLCDPEVASASTRIDAWLRVAPTEDGAFRSGTLVHVHAGTQERMATVAVLGRPSIAPGESAPVQVVLRESLHAWQGDRIVLRDASASRTIAGGRVLDIDPPARYRQTPERLVFLDSQRHASPQARLASALAQAPLGLRKDAWLRAQGLREWPFDPSSLPGAVSAGAGWLITQAQLSRTQEAVVAALDKFHREHPQEVGPERNRLRRLAAPRTPQALWDALLSRMGSAGLAGVRNGFVHLPAHGEQLRAADRVVAERALPMLLQGRFDPPWVRDIAKDAKLPEDQVRQVLARLGKTGEAYQVVKDLYYHPHTVRELAGLARDIAARDKAITAAAFRDATGLGRKRAIQILEFLDRIGFLRRAGDTHLVRPGTPLFPGEARAA